MSRRQCAKSASLSIRPKNSWEPGSCAAVAEPGEARMISIPEFLTTAPRHLFFTGKGGVGKTSLACASAVLLADKGRRVLLVSTDPASNLDAVLGTKLANSPIPVAGVPNLQAMNIDPEQATREYRERTVGPYRSALPPQELKLLEERLSGAC